MAGSGGPAQQVAAIWRQVGINQKISILLVGAGSAAAVLAMVFWGGRPSYGLLYSGLSRKDASAVVTQLEADSIPYRLDDNGATVLVPADQVQKARAALMQQGIPTGGDGFEILDKRTLGMTDFGERKTYLRALQGELARTISQIDSIEAARVHVSSPEPSVFLEQEQPATASVLLHLRNGATLSAAQAGAIGAFVAGSVEGLEPGQVTITDQFLNPLSRRATGAGPGAASAHLEAQREIERHLTTKVQNMLEAFLGPGRSTVSVSADIALKREEHHSVEYTEEGRVARTEKTTTSKTDGGGGPAGGTPGAGPTGGRGAGASGTTGGTSDSTEEIEYEVPRTEIVKVDNGVTIKRLTVSVLVAGRHTVTKDAEGKETRTFEALPQAELTKLEEAVSQAVGADTTRTDTVKVECVEFNEPEPAISEDEMASDRRWEMMLRLGRQASTVVVVLAFLVVVRSMLRRARSAREAAEAAAAEALEAAETEAREAAIQAAASTAATPSADLPLRTRIAAAVASNPDSAAELLKSWYKDSAVGSRS